MRQDKGKWPYLVGMPCLLRHSAISERLTFLGENAFQMKIHHTLDTDTVYPLTQWA